MKSEVLPIANLPFLRSLCWQGQKASIAELSEDEIVQMYERNWRYRGVIADLGEEEGRMLLKLAARQCSWLVSELQAYEMET